LDFVKRGSLSVFFTNLLTGLKTSHIIRNPHKNVTAPTDIPNHVNGQTGVMPELE
jgi:hypothetical protein